MKENDVERLRKKREQHWVQESTGYVRTYELSSTLEDRRKGTRSGEIRTSDHLDLGRRTLDELIPSMGNKYIHVFSRT